MDLPGEDWARSVEAELHRLPDGLAGPAMAERAGRALFGDELLRRLPPGYAEQTRPAEAAWDCAVGLGLAADEGTAAGRPGPGRLRVTSAQPEGAGDFRLRRAGRERVELSSWLPVLDSFGLVVVEAVPWHFAASNRSPAFYVDDIGLRFSPALSSVAAADGLGVQGSPASARLVGAIVATTTGRAEVSRLNSLVLSAGLTWQEVNLLSAYCRYRRQAGGLRAAEKADAIISALVAFPGTAVATVALFKARLAPAEPGAPAPGGGRGDEPGARREMDKALAGVPDLEHDEALHELLAMVEGTTRSNWALGGRCLAVKFSSSSLGFLPTPRPFAEVYVWSTWFEGLHLRFGPVARGGVRWSDRTSDLRGEVLGLARAQVKKNSLIVPTGAKGAFCLRPGPPAPELGLPTGRDERGRAAYEAFVGALLDLTDNVVEGQVEHPPISCRDGDDPYLVVAADKGTAHFSDVANSISIKRGFWLGDAFASGGSNGYDHKALGITARGAWLAVRRHFRALGMRPDEEPLRVAGVGDMSGDVFGNAMLQSPQVRLVAAFDHRNVFVDPEPGAEAFDERKRLSELSTSSWADYDLSKASEGAAVYDRSSKQAELSPQARSVLGLRSATVAPPELVKAVLTAPVDLFFFGGIGTFVRGPGENDVEIEDAANDDVRTEAKELRARVVTEGANLGLTQKARAAYSRRGGRVNADFVDNAAGVALSDREVNMKVLLGLAVASCLLPAEQSQALLGQAEEQAALSVLAQVDGGILALDRSASASPGALPAYEGLLRDLEAEGLLDRDVEALPGDEELARRAQAGAGFSRPELAVLVAYARSELARQVAVSALAAGTDLDGLVSGYFPLPVRQACRGLIARHPLRPQLAASQLANEVLEHMGPVWAHETAAETGHPLWEVAAAYWEARQVLGAERLLAELASVASALPVEAEEAVRDALARALGRAARWYLLNPGPGPLAARVAVERGSAPDAERVLRPPEALGAELEGLGAPPGLVAETVRLVTLRVVGEVGAVARGSGRAVPEAVAAMGEVATLLSTAAVDHQLGLARPGDLWDRRQAHLLSDDLGRQVVKVASRALSAFPDRDGPGAVEGFLALQPGPVAHYKALARQLDGPRPAGLSLLSLAVRALGEVAAGGPGREALERSV